MSDQLERLGIVVTAEGIVELSDGTRLAGKDVQKLADNLGDLGKKLVDNVSAAKASVAATKAVEDASKSAASAVAGQTVANTAAAAESKSLRTEVGAAGGALDHFSLQNKAATRELLVLAHELAQGNFKRFGQSMMVLGEQTGAASLIFSATGVLILGMVAALGGFAFAAYKGAEQSRELNNAIHATGDYAGMTAGQLQALAGKMAVASDTTIGKGREAMQALVASGRFTATSIESVGTAALLMAKYTGQSEEDVLKHFAKMGDGVTEWAFKTNEQYHFLSLAQYKHIKALEDQGKAQDAMRETGEALIAHFKNQGENLGLLERAIKSAKNAWSEFWNAAFDIGRQETLEGKLARLQATLAEKNAQGPLNSLTAGAHQTGVGRLQSEIDEAARDQYWASFQANANSQAAAKTTADIAAQHKSDKHQGAADVSGQNFLDGLEKQWRAAEGEARLYDTVLEHILTNEKKFTVDQGYRALYLAEQIDARKDKQRADAEEIKYMGQIAALREQEAAAIASQHTADTQELQDRQFEISLLGKTAEQVQRLTAAYQLQKQVKQRQVAVLDASQAGKLTPSEVQAQLDYIDSNASAQLASRNDQITDQFKPGWQKLLDGWQNTTQLMVDAYNGSMNAIVQGGEDMWVTLITQGKFNARSFVTGIATEMAKLSYRQNIAGPLASFGNGILSKIFGGGAVNLGTVTGADMDIFTMAHTGGIAGSSALGSKFANPAVFAGAPRFHTGGIAGNEVPIIAQKGEGIFTKEQMANLQPAGNNNQVTFAPVINIDARTDRAEVYSLVTRAVKAGQADLLDGLSRGTIR
jgi:hypothetical protein